LFEKEVVDHFIKAQSACGGGGLRSVRERKNGLRGDLGGDRGLKNGLRAG